MERLTGPQGKGISLHRHIWRCVLLAGLFAPLMGLMLLAGPNQALAATLTPSKNTFSVSPTRGPVDAVIAVSGSGVFFSDGTQVNLGYTVDFRTCIIVSGGKPGMVQNSAFSGWFRWPASTGTGSFGVCATANSFTFQVGSYQVLSASAPRVLVAPTRLKAGQQATVSGANFLPGGTHINLFWRSASGGQSVFLGTVSSNGSGAFAHTFTVPARSSTGSYIVTGNVGSGSAPTLSAATTFHVNGITLVAVPTPTANPKPTAVSTSTSAPVTSPHAVLKQPTTTNGGGTNLFLPIALSGVLLIVLALGAGVLVVRRQRSLAMFTDPTSGPLLWPEAVNMVTGGANSGVGAFTPWPGMMYPGGNSPLGSPGIEYAPPPGATLPQPAWHREAAVPFDPGLIEAMREAQVSLFATPRPPVSEEVEVQ